MKITSGNKRIVVLLGDQAFKIGKIRFVRLFFRLLILPFSKKLRERFLVKYGDTWSSALFNDLFAGLLCNRREYDYFHQTKDKRVIPTIKKFLGGHIIVQVRGQTASNKDVEKIYPWYRGPEYKIANLDKPEQYCTLPADGAVRITDYGDISTIEFLKRI